MNNALSTAATVLKPIDSASIYEQQGKFALEPLIEKKQKMQQAQSEFAGVMSDIDKFSKEVWEQDWQELSKQKEEFMSNAAQAYEKAYMDGRDMSVMERYQIQKGLGEIGQRAQLSKQNKDIYDYYSKEIVKNPDKYDVQSSLAMLNQGYRDKNLGEREIGTFLVPKIDWAGFEKSIAAPSITRAYDGPKGGSTTTVANKEAIRQSIISGIMADPAKLEYVLSMDDAGQKAFIDGMVDRRANTVDLVSKSTKKEYIPKYSVSTGTVAPEANAGGTVFSNTPQSIVKITTKPADRTIKRGNQNLVLDQIVKGTDGKLKVIGYEEVTQTANNTSRKINIPIVLEYVDVKDQLEGIGGTELIKTAESLGGAVTPAQSSKGKSGVGSKYN